MAASTTSAPPPSLAPLPSVWQRIAAPAALTLAITLGRLYAELAKLPSFLASSEPGPRGSLLGIWWLAPILGWWFARAIVGRTDRPKKALAKTLIAYGFAARIPVVVLTWIALEKGDAWNTHLTKFGDPPPDWTPTTIAGKVAAVAMGQFVFWIFVWTLGTGMLVGALWMRKQRRGVTAPAQTAS